MSLQHTLSQHSMPTSSCRRAVWTIVAAAMLLHLSLIWLPAINLEWVFADGAQYFAHHDPTLLKHYFSFEANTLGTPLLGAALHRVLPFLDYTAALRILSALSLPLLGYSLLKLHALLKVDYNPAILTAVVLLNPLIWTFGGRGTADLFPAALTLFAITLLWEPDGSPMRLAAAIVAYGIAITLKYHAALLLPLVCLEILSRPGANIRRALWRSITITASILFIPALYVFLIRRLYGFWLIPPKFRAIHAPHLGLDSILTNLVEYAAYLSLLLLPYSLSVVWERINSRRRALVTLVAGSVIFITGACGLKLSEEMSFGPLDAYVSSRIYSGLFLVFAAIFVCLSLQVLAARINSSAHRYLSCMVLGVAIFIAVLSVTRPAQRYLLFVLPLSYFFVINARKAGKYLTAATVAVYAILIVFITLNQVATGEVAARMTRQIIVRGLLADTLPGKVITGYAGNLFPDAANDAASKRFTVIAGKSPNAIVTVESHPAPLVHKVLSLVRFQDAPPASDDAK